MYKATAIRDMFLDYFESQGHTRVRSGPLFLRDDPTLLFTNAGMNQFKNVFLGQEKRDYKRAATSQKCLRVSGKHNDLEMVGRTPRHHTFFEMLGNFSFADYFKKEAIEYAWELCTEVYGLPSDRISITVFREDNEALSLWCDLIGIPRERVLKLGEADNYWSMGNTGPCGPCSELHYDLGESPLGHEECTVECNCGRFVEIWNLVFMQHNRDIHGNITPLPSPSIDTGMGLERIACILQGVTSNYDTDLLKPLIVEACHLTGVNYGEEEKKDVSLRILADHGRACSFLINEGVLPSNEGRGYVLRKILRRAIRHGKMLGQESPFIYTLTSTVAKLMGSAYPELEHNQKYTAAIIKQEEEQFNSTLRHGIQLFDEIVATTRKRERLTLPGQDLFRLYDTYGFPLDLAREIATEQGLQVDEIGFKTEMEKQRKRARLSWKGEEKNLKPVYKEVSDLGFQTKFTGYSQLHDTTSKVLAIVQRDRIVGRVEAGETAEVILNCSPFYAESGGQVADKGTFKNTTLRASVEHVFTSFNGLYVHRVQIQKGFLQKGDLVDCLISFSERDKISRNHTATHLLHSALREILGEHVRQSGSLVAPERLRFDFTHYRPTTHRELREIEELVNEKIRENIRIQTEIQDREEAIERGAMALFGEKYQRQVRVVRLPGFSMELCGGTHARRTGEIGIFKIIHEGSISAGIRRIEGITGKVALNRFLDNELLLASLSKELHTPPGQLSSAVASITQDLRNSKKEIESLHLKLVQRESGDILNSVHKVKGIRVLSQQIEGLGRNTLRQLADQFKQRLKTGVVILGTPADEKVSLVVMVTPDLTDQIHAGKLIRKIAAIVQGAGGGKPDMAEAGGKDPSRLKEALEKSPQLVEELLQ